MKKIITGLFVIISLTQFLNADEILNDNMKDIYDSKEQKAKTDADLVRDSWINPLKVELNYTKSKDTYISRDIMNKQASINLDQEIFKSGGIYSTIKKGGLLKTLNTQVVSQEKKSLLAIIYANTIMIKKIDLQIKKLAFDIKSKELTIKKKQQLYEHGLIDISDLDERIIELSRLINEVYNLKSEKFKLIKEFKYISDKSYESIDLSFLTLSSFDEFLERNIQIKVKELTYDTADADKNILYSSYLPKVSLFGNYSYNDTSLSTDKQYYQYGAKISMPIDYNSAKIVETARLKTHIASLQTNQTKEYETSFYQYAVDRLENIDGKIKNTNNTIARYENLYEMVKALYKGDLRTIDDVTIMQNRLESSKLDIEILNLDKKSVLNDLYKRIN